MNARIGLRLVVSLVFAIVVTLPAFGQAKPDATAPVKIPDSATAVRVAEQALSKIYGGEKIESEKPFTASLSDGVWHVQGTLYCKDENGNVIRNACDGGVAMADIRRSNGRVVRTGHGK